MKYRWLSKTCPCGKHRLLIYRTLSICKRCRKIFAEGSWKWG